MKEDKTIIIIVSIFVVLILGIVAVNWDNITGNVVMDEKPIVKQTTQTAPKPIQTKSYGVASNSLSIGAGSGMGGTTVSIPVTLNVPENVVNFQFTADNNLGIVCSFVASNVLNGWTVTSDSEAGVITVIGTGSSALVFNGLNTVGNLNCAVPQGTAQNTYLIDNKGVVVGKLNGDGTASEVTGITAGDGSLTVTGIAPNYIKLGSVSGTNGQSTSIPVQIGTTEAVVNFQFTVDGPLNNFKFNPSSAVSGWTITTAPGSITVIATAPQGVSITGLTDVGTISGTIDGSGVMSVTGTVLGSSNPDGTSSQVADVAGLSGSVTIPSNGGSSGGSTGGSGGSGGGSGGGSPRRVTSDEPVVVSREYATKSGNVPEYDAKPTPVEKPKVVTTEVVEEKGFWGNAISWFSAATPIGWVIVGIILVIVLAVIFLSNKPTVKK